MSQTFVCKCINALFLAISTYSASTLALNCKFEVNQRVFREIIYCVSLAIRCLQARLLVHFNIPPWSQLTLNTAELNQD